MKINVSLLKLLVIVSLLVTVVRCSPKKDQNHDEYTCPMHPDIVKDKPGKCPVCGMDLVKKKPAEKSSLILDTKKGHPGKQNAVVADLPSYGSKELKINVNGVIRLDSRNEITVPARVAGRIEKLFLTSDQQAVSRGEKLLELYSPEFVSAQQDLLFLLNSDAQNSVMIAAAKRKLFLLGISDAELSQVIASGKPVYAVGIYSPVDGYVQMESNSVKEGSYVQNGQSVFKLVSAHTLWADFDLRPSDAAMVRLNDPIVVDASKSHGSLHIDFLQPVINASGTFAKARVYLTGARDKYLPGEFVKGVITIQSGAGIWIPASSAIDLGTRTVAVVKNAGTLIPREIMVDGKSGDWLRIGSGIGRSDSIASHVRFLFDNDSFVALAN